MSKELKHTEAMFHDTGRLAPQSKKKANIETAMENQSEEQVKSQQEDGAVEDFSEKAENGQFEKDDAEFKATQEQPVYANPEAYGTIEKGNPFDHIDEHNKAMLAYRQKFGCDCDYNLTTKDIYNLIEKGDSNYQTEGSDGKPYVVESNGEWIPQPHEQRVIDEHFELSEKAKKLYDFINSNPIFKTLPEDVQFLRRAQLFHMLQYSVMLDEIIYLFKGGSPRPKSIGEETIGFFGTENEKVFDLKYISMMMINATNLLGNDPRRNAIVRTDMEKVQMMAVKSVFSK